MPLFHLVPPAIDLVAHHRRLFDKQRAFWHQGQQRFIRAGDCAEKFPARKHADAACSRGLNRHLVFIGIRIFGLGFEVQTLTVQPAVHSGQQSFRHRRFSQRQQLRLIQTALRTLRLRIEFSDGFNFVAEEFDANGPVSFRRIYIQNSSPARELSWHFDQVHLGVTDAGQVARQHLDVYFFSATKRYGKPGVVVAIEQLQRRRLYGRNENLHRAGRQLPQSRGSLFLNVGMRRKIFERKHIVSRQPNHRGWVYSASQLATRANCRLQLLSGLVVGHHHNYQLLGGPRHQRNIQRSSGRGEAGHTSPPRMKAEMPSYALKSRSLLQFRKDFADERENHLNPVYQSEHRYHRSLGDCIHRLWQLAQSSPTLRLKDRYSSPSAFKNE